MWYFNSRQLKEDKHCLTMVCLLIQESPGFIFVCVLKAELIALQMCEVNKVAKLAFGFFLGFFGSSDG